MFLGIRCCIFQPAFGCCAPKTLVKITSKNIISYKKCKVLKNIFSTNSRGLDLLGLLYMLFSEVGEVHERVLEHPKIQRLLDDSTPTHFDVTFVSPLFNEMGLYFGRKFESSVILYMAPVKTMLSKF